MDRITPVIRKLIYRYCGNHPEIEIHPVEWAATTVFFVSPKTLRRRLKIGGWIYDEVERAARFFKTHHIPEAMAADIMDWREDGEKQDAREGLRD